MELVYEIGLVARIRMNAHSLNNEGTTGNVTEPRTIILSDGRKTDGISGEMQKHIHAFSLFHIAKELSNKFYLCPACETFSPMKADGNPKVKEKKSVEEALREALLCVLCDTHGFLVQKPTLSRKSTVEFGWALALPDQFHREMHVHTRVAIGEKGRKEGEQMIYNRPTRSGLYAFVSVFQPWRIGLDEIDYKYVLENEARKARYELVLEAYKSMFTRIEGAMTTTRMPHIEEINGVIVQTFNAQPVPLISPLRDDYIEEIEKIANSDKILKFNSLFEFITAINNLKKATPYTLGVS